MQVLRLAAQRRAVPVLAAAQVLGGVGVASGIAVNGLLAQQISGSTALAGLAQTMAILGAALLALPLARLAQVGGRRRALSSGYTVAATGAALSILAGVLDSFVLLLLGAALFGGATASGLQSRYAALDSADASRRGRSLSLVVWATTVGSVLGPNLSGPGGALGRSLGIGDLTGPYLFSLAGFVAAAAVVWLLLRPDPLQAARAAGSPQPAGSPMPSGSPRAQGGLGAAAAFRSVLARPAALLGLVTVGTAHAVMVAVMVMTPVHLHDGGATLQVVGIVISVHIAGMYALSPVMGVLADRVGRPPVIGAGLALLALASVLAATGGAGAHGRLGVALLLLGVGWSACLVAGSTLLSESVPGDVRVAVQGLSDLVMGVAAAGAGALAGPVLAVRGYPTLALGSLLLLVPVLVLLAHRVRETRFAPVGGRV